MNHSFLVLMFIDSLIPFLSYNGQWNGTLNFIIKRVLDTFGRFFIELIFQAYSYHMSHLPKKMNSYSKATILKDKISFFCGKNYVLIFD